MRKERVVLENHAEPACHRLDARDILPVNHDAAGIGSLEPREEAECRRLSTAAGPEERQELATREREREAVHGGHAIEPLDQALEAQKLAHRSRPVPRTLRSQ
jgi:hypothetical protein